MNKRDIEAVYPLSPMQEGMLFHTLAEPESGVYFEQLTCTLRGNLVVWAFEEAWKRVVERHAALRTSFVWKRLDRILQVVQKRVEIPFQKKDWIGLSTDEQRVLLEEFLRSERIKGFNPAKAPLLRLGLMRTGKDAHSFVLSNHHLLFDGWSLPLLIREVLLFYDSLQKGLELSLDAPRPYRDYIAWLKRQDAEEAESFWRGYLEGFTAPTAVMPGKYSGHEENDHCEISRLLSPQTVERIRSMARKHGLTLNTLVQGAWAILLSRYSGQDNVVFGATVSGRPAEVAGTETMVGLFINTLPILAQIPSGEPALSWLKDLQNKQALLRQYEYCSLTDIQGWSRVPRDRSLFESILVFENYPLDKALLEGGVNGSLRVENIRTIEKTNYPLTLASGPDLGLCMTYDGRRFDSHSIRLMLGHLETLLCGMAADPGQPLGRLNLLTEAERRQVLWDWNDIHSAVPEHGCIHRLFEAQAERSPDAVAAALSAPAFGRITYGELNRRANQLAHRLQGMGVGPESVVGICMERSLEMVVGLMGILKAGAAYLPLDPAYPPERIAFMVEDSGTRVILTQEKIEGRGTWDVGRNQRSEVRVQGHSEPAHSATRNIICLDAHWPAIARESAENPEIALSPSNLAYLIYTSGSTGKPKGVMVSHRAVVNHNTAFAKRFHLGSEDRVLQFSTINFDAAVEEIFPAWLCGAGLILRPEEAAPGIEETIGLIEAEGITILDLPTAYWHELAFRPVPSSVRLVVVGGEEALGERLALWQKTAGVHVEWVNTYGPTEATVIATAFTPEPEAWDPLFKVPIGRPIANVSAYIVDNELRPVPVGVAGELCIGGIGLARGYLNRPELTAERFIPDPFEMAGDRSPTRQSRYGDGARSEVRGRQNQGGERLYRTGDLARFLPDGNVEFLGRIDHQVKIRGFRIEPGEIEAMLCRHEGVGRGVVLCCRDDAGEKYLAAYVAPQGEGRPTAEGLREYLHERLPFYMVPAAFVIMDELPLTPSGKVDRKALPAPEKAPGLPRACIAPRTPLEGLICELWSQVLGVERVGAKDNFYDLGGHSLKATQVVSRMQRILAKEVKIRDLLETLTPAGLAERLETRQKESSGLKAPPFEWISRDGPLPLSFSQERLWFLDQLAPGALFYNIPMAVRMEGRLDIEALQAALNEMVRRHESLRTCFSQVRGNPVQVVLPEWTMPLPVQDLSPIAESDREAKAGQMATEEARRPFDLQRGPLLRGKLLKLGEEEHVMTLVVHHIVSDGWSIGLMIRELSALYEAYAHHWPTPLPELAIQYADFAGWQRRWLQGAVLEEQLAYWRGRLKDAPSMLELPTDRPRQTIQNPKGAICPFVLSGEISEGLRKLSRDRDVTLFMTLLGAFGVLLYRYSGQEDICVGMPIANRNRREIEDLIGFFVNTLVMRMDLSGKPRFDQVLERVRRSALEAYTHQDLPFEVLVEAIRPQRDLSHTPLFQVMFTMDPPLAAETSLPGLTLTPMEIGRGSAVFDLTLCVRDHLGGLSGYFEYNSDLFDESTIERMAGHYRRLLESMAADPEGSIEEATLLTEAEERQVLLRWNDAEAETPVDRCVHALFEAQARMKPDAVALIFEEKALSYRELNRRANQLARYLMDLGVGSEALVGISMERSPEMIIGILGVLKAGAAYLPLDPTYPQERIAYMVEDSGVRVILTLKETWDVGRGTLDEQAKKRNEEGVPFFVPRPTSHVQRSLVFLDTDWPLISRASDENPAVNVTTQNLAYVIYTSGSTGRPKGTMLSHAGLSNLTAAQRQAFGIDGQSRVLQFSPLSFDASVWETFMALANGATLCLARREVLASGVELAALLREKRVTNVTLPPSVVRVLPREDLPELRTVIAAGEACTAELVAGWGRDREFYNGYGPTETTVCASMKLCHEEDGPPPIGRPIHNTRLYILDGNLQPVPAGVPGELCVGGISLARGYLGRPELSAEKFIPDPFKIDRGQSPTRQSRYVDGARSEVGGQPKSRGQSSEIRGQKGERLYRTGDLVKYLPGGDIQFLGRIDEQVKVRGFRIELGEVDEALHRVKGVKEGVVLAREDRLVAYVVPEREHIPTAAELKASMREKLPEYMVPSLFVYLEEHLPMTPSGKVDRKALPAPDRERTSEREYAPPTNPAEETLSAMYRELLGLERIGIHDDFFDLGGHSLLAAQLVSRIREHFALEIPLRTLFEHSSVFEIAQQISSLGGRGGAEREKLADLLKKVESLSEEEVKARLAKKRAPSRTDSQETTPGISRTEDRV